MNFFAPAAGDTVRGDEFFSLFFFFFFFFFSHSLLASLLEEDYLPEKTFSLFES